MRLLSEEQLDFSDVLILPKRSTLKTRNDVDITREFVFPHSTIKWTGYPVIAANMLTGTFEMARALSKYNMLTALHKHYSLKLLTEFFINELAVSVNTFYTLGISNKDYDKYKSLCDLIPNNKPSLICIDVANGYMEKFVQFVRRFREENNNTVIMAGNVVTGEMVEELILAGADIVKCGIGSGQNCLTRRVAGVGRPQLSTVIECADHAHGLKGWICSDGGCSQPADLNIAFSAGADFVMLGTMLSGTDECAGDIIEKDGERHKVFYGMSSNSAMNAFGNGKDSYKASEGRTTLMPCIGSVNSIAEELHGSTRSMLSYIGANKLKEASKRATLIKVNNRLNTYAEKYTIGN